jgi:ribonuclease BN (tRNA processing enzyme)
MMAGDELRLTVLGAGPAWANPGGACSGYLVSSGDDHVLLECGFGILSRLRQAIPLNQLRAVVISHLHADHFMDLVPLRYGLKYGKLRADPALPLFAPPGATEFFHRLGLALDGDATFFDGTFRLTEYSPTESHEIGPFTFTFTRVKHYIPSYGMAIRNGRTLAFSADAAPCPGVLQVARAADLFLCEAAINGPHEDDPNPDNRGHMTAREAADLAREAGAARLLLTHYRLDTNHPTTLDEARAAFGGPTEFAAEGQSYIV